MLIGHLWYEWLFLFVAWHVIGKVVNKLL